MGCGCGKNRLTMGGNQPAKRTTVYQVMEGLNVVQEFGTLPEARKKAAEIGGRVKVSSKMG